MAKLICVAIVTLCAVGCSRQHSSQPAPAAASGQPPSAVTMADKTSTAPAVSGEPAPAPAEPTLTIPAGSRIRVRLARTLSTRYDRAGERFTAYLDEPIVSGDRVIVPKGTEFQGRVTEARNSGRLRGRAYLGLTLVSFRLNGETYPVTTTADIRASRSHKKRNLAIIGGGTGFGTVVGAVAGGGVGAAIGAGAGAAAGTAGAFVTGRKRVTLSAETPLTFSLRNGITVRG